MTDAPTPASGVPSVEDVRLIIEEAFADRCETCLRPIASDDDWATAKEGERPDLCWEPRYCGQYPLDRDAISAEAVTAWFALVLAEARAAAWDEGETAGREAERARWKRLTDDRIPRPPLVLPNPYRRPDESEDA
jgi:hypothetical protein